MFNMIKNRLKEKIQEEKVVVGTFLFIPSPTVIEILGYSGFDFAIIDTEHSPTGSLDTVLLENIIRAAEVSGIAPLVRIPERSKIMTQKALDSGALGVVVPWIRNKEDAIQAVKDAKYPPDGHRGSCYLTRQTGYSAKFTPDYWSQANENTMVVPLIEDQIGVDNIEDIISVEGVDFIFFGARDYSMSSGYPSVDNPATRKTREHLKKVCKKHKMPLAHFLYPPFEVSVKKAINDGAKVLVSGGDNALLLHTCRTLVNIVRDYS